MAAAPCLDANVRPGRRRGHAREFFRGSVCGQRNLCTSAEVLQELMHAYLPVNRRRTLEAAMSLVAGSEVEVWPLEREDVELARQLHEQLPALGARDLCHLASCQRRGVTAVKTFDQAFAAAAGSAPRATAAALSPRRPPA